MLCLLSLFTFKKKVILCIIKMVNIFIAIYDTIGFYILFLFWICFVYFILAYWTSQCENNNLFLLLTCLGPIEPLQLCTPAAPPPSKSVGPNLAGIYLMVVNYIAMMGDPKDVSSRIGVRNSTPLNGLFSKKKDSILLNDMVLNRNRVSFHLVRYH